MRSKLLILFILELVVVGLGSAVEKRLDGNDFSPLAQSLVSHTQHAQMGLPIRLK